MTTTIEYTSNVNTYLKCFFNKQNSSSAYNLIITKFNNVILDENRKTFEVSVNFFPEPFVEYIFVVVEATSSYLQVKNNGYIYKICFINEPTQLQDKTNQTNSIFNYDQKSDFESDSCSGFGSDTCSETYSEQEADGYDSEGYYFRLR